MSPSGVLPRQLATYPHDRWVASGAWTKPRYSFDMAQPSAQTVVRACRPRSERIMAKSQKKSNREVRKPKAEKAAKQNASKPSLKPGGIAGLENMKNA
jgi:hypothetical protein